MAKFDFEDMPCYNGHITTGAHDCVCGYKYQYNGIMNYQEKISNPRAKNTYLKYTFLKDVECNLCKELMYKKLNK